MGVRVRGQKSQAKEEKQGRDAREKNYLNRYRGSRESGPAQAATTRIRQNLWKKRIKFALCLGKSGNHLILPGGKRWEKGPGMGEELGRRGTELLTEGENK